MTARMCGLRAVIASHLRLFRRQSYYASISTAAFYSGFEVKGGLICRCLTSLTILADAKPRHSIMSRSCKALLITLARMSIKGKSGGRMNIRYAALLTAMLVALSSVRAQVKTIENLQQASRPVSKAQSALASRGYSVLNINNIATWHGPNGISNLTPAGHEGLTFPRRTATVVYQDGLIWGGKAFTDAALNSAPVNGQRIRVGGGTYIAGTVAGSVVGFGSSAVPEDPNLAGVRVYRIRRDYAQMSDSELIQDALDSFEHLNESEVTPAEKDEIVAQYALDWQEWPVSKGAPYIERNGVPAYQAPPPFSATFTLDSLISGNYDEPGIAGVNINAPADQVLWMVFNDLDDDVCRLFAGSYPLGLEVQKTVWGYKRSDALGNAYFNRYRLINKGGVDIDDAAGDQLGSYFIDSMYVCQWSDADLGSFSDDLVGCDSSLSLGFVYNGRITDESFQKFSLPPPAVGYDFLSGPIVPSWGDTAIFDFQRRSNRKNLWMSSFGYFAGGSTYYDPPIQPYNTSTGRWWKVLRGFAPTGDFSTADIPYEHGPYPFSVFPLSGDPVFGTGWLDGAGTDWSFASADRRVLLASGPFMFAPGDTQDVVVVFVGGIGADRLSSVAVMKANDIVAQKLYDQLFDAPTVLAPTVTTVYPNALTTEVSVDVWFPADLGVQSAQVIFDPIILSEIPFSMPLFDDGLHGDGASGDGRWANAQAVSNRKHPYHGSLTIATPAGTQSDPDFIPIVSLRPAPVIGDWTLQWEDGRQNRLLDTDELATFAVTVQNIDGQNAIDALTVQNLEFTDGMYGSKIYAGPVPAGSVVGGTEPFVLSVRGAPSGIDSTVIHYTLSYDGFTINGSHLIPVAPWTPDPVWRDTLPVAKVSGITTIGVVPVIADPTILTGHDYHVAFYTLTDGSGNLGWSLLDVNLNETKLTDQRLWPGDPVWPHPIVDGVQYIVKSAPDGFDGFYTVWNARGPVIPFQQAALAFNNNGFPLLPDGTDRPDGTIQQSIGLRAPQGWAFHTGMSSGTTDAGIDYFVSRVTSAGLRWPEIAPYDFEMRFTSGGSVAWNAFTNMTMTTVPFELWNIGIDTPDDSSDDYRLFPYILDVDGNDQWNLLTQAGVDSVDNGSHMGVADHSVSTSANDPFTDWIHWVKPANTSPGQSGYNAIAAEVMSGTHGYLNASTAGTDVLRRIVLVGYNFGDVSAGIYPQSAPETGTVFRITTRKKNGPGDIVLVRSVPATDIVPNTGLPGDFELAQNYPNPFNPTTEILYRLPEQARLRLSVYDMLGREIAVLYDGEKAAGSYTAIWKALAVSSGVYFCRLEATTSEGHKAARLRKLVLLK